MLFDIFVLTSFIYCFHERFSLISTSRNLVAFSLSIALLSIFKKGSGSLNFFFFVVVVVVFFLRLGKIENILLLLNLAIFISFKPKRYFVKFTVHIRKQVLYVYA